MAAGPGWRRIRHSDGFLFYFGAMDGGSREQDGGEECERGGRSQWTDQWKSLYGAYGLARSCCDGCVVAGNGPLQPPPEQTHMMNSDAFACQQLVPTSSGAANASGAWRPPHALQRTHAAERLWSKWHDFSQNYSMHRGHARVRPLRWNLKWQ